MQGCVRAWLAGRHVLVAQRTRLAQVVLGAGTQALNPVLRERAANAHRAVASVLRALLLRYPASRIDVQMRVRRRVCAQAVILALQASV